MNTPSQTRSMHMSDLQSPQKSARDKNLSDIEFGAQCTAANREIETLRYDVQLLMTKAHAYCKDSGVSIGSPFLPSTPPRFAGDDLQSTALMSKTSMTPQPKRYK